MNQIRKLEKYCKIMLLDSEIIEHGDEDFTLLINDKGYRVISDDQRLIFDQEMEFSPLEILTEDEIGYVYEFGGRWYLQESGEDVSMEELRYIGEAKQKLPTKSFLGIRSGYELMNGMGLYKDWVGKAKFLGVESLAICERNTLSGVLVFQNECASNGIKSIIGLTIPVKHKNFDKTYDMKLYAKSFQGWLNLLKFNNILNVDGKHAINEDYLIENSEDLFIVSDPKNMEYKYASKEILSRIDFYQLETVRFLNEEKDDEFILNLELFMKSDLEPISIRDAFYLEQIDYHAREVLWTTAKAFDDKTDNQFFKNNDQYAAELINMFESSNKSWIPLFKKAIANEAKVVADCNFKYDTDTRHLPKYIMSESESSEHETNEKLFLHLIKKGFRDRDIKLSEEYLDRLKVEIDVLKTGDVIDYFLALHDIIQYSKREGLLTGIGRGSAGGSLIAYLLGIIQINPLEFDLLFERFLNKGRMGEYQDRPFYTFVGEDGSEIGLAEGALLRVIRDDKERIVFVHEVIEGDEIIKY